MTQAQGSARAQLLDALRVGGAAPCIREEDRSWSYADLWDRSRQWAARLAAGGVSCGDRVAALAPPSADLVAAMLGAYVRGAIWVPINPRYRAEEVGHILQDCTPTILLCDEVGPEQLPAKLAPRILELRGHTDVACADAAVLHDDAPAMLIYTSGTTGRSKGVELSYHAVVRGIEALTGLWGWSASDVLSLQLPLFHVHGLCIGVHGSLLAHMEMLLHTRFEAASVVRDIAERGATVFMGVPTMYTRLLSHLSGNPDAARSVRSARLFTAGSAALPSDDLRVFEDLTGHRILERYGMSETLITFSNPLQGERRPGSVGREVPGVRARVVDDHGEPVESGDVGELQVQTPAMMTGYWRNPDATAQAFDGPWFRTGDVVMRDSDGYTRIVGRSSVDIIKSGGFKISAREIEEVLLRHPAVLEAAVVGLPDPEWGERIVAAVVLCEALEDPQGTLAAHVSKHLADYKKPRGVYVVTELPRNALGKLQKVALKDVLSARGA